VFTEAVLLGNVAISHRGKQLQWDGEADAVHEPQEANDASAANPRSGWDVTA
jgi:hypothetical protein